MSAISWPKTSPCVVLSFEAGSFALLVDAFTAAEVFSLLSSVVALAEAGPGLPIYSEWQKCPNVWYFLIFLKITYRLQQMEHGG